jgi:hypothetical protein
MKCKAYIAVLDVEALERARVARGLLQKDVAREACIGLSTCWRAFSTGVAGIKAARAIAHVLGLDLATLWVEAPSLHPESAA